MKKKTKTAKPLNINTLKTNVPVFMGQVDAIQFLLHRQYTEKRLSRGKGAV